MFRKASLLTLLVFDALISLDAAVLTVTSLADSGVGSLRDQVAASSPGDTIQFAVNGVMTLNGAININHTLYVQGPSPSKLTVSGNLVDRVFVTGGNPVLLAGMTITKGLVAGPDGLDGGFWQNGTVGLPAYAGAILNSSNSDLLILSNCWVNGNTAQGGKGGRGGDNPPATATAPGNGGVGGSAHSGAIYATGRVFLVNCTFSSNSAIGGLGGMAGNNLSFAALAGGTGGGGGDADSGVIRVDAVSTHVFVTNCTFSGNAGIGGGGGDGGTNAATFFGGAGGKGGAGGCGVMSGGGLYTEYISCTIVSNSAVGGAGGAGGFGVPPGATGAVGNGDGGALCGYTISCGDAIPLGNTILADNYASHWFTNYFSRIFDLGFNYIGDDPFPLCFSQITRPTRQGTVPSPLHAQLAPLAQNGSGLPTHAPLKSSPVIDWGFSFDTTTDERTAPRPVGVPLVAGSDGSDVGAFEFGSAPLGMSTVSNNAILSWPGYYGDFVLQSATNLQGSNAWSNLPGAPVLVGGRFNVTNRMTDAVRFYRLVSP